MGSLKKDINSYLNHYADLDKLRTFIEERNQESTIRVSYPNFSIDKIEDLYFRLLFESDIVEFKKEWTMRPDYTSYDFYNTVIYWPIILYVNDVESIEKYRDFDSIVVPKLSVIEEINRLSIRTPLVDLSKDKLSNIFSPKRGSNIFLTTVFPFSRKDTMSGSVDLDSNLKPINSKGITLKNLILSATDDLTLFYKYLKNYFGMTYQQINDYIRSLYDKKELRDVMEQFFLYYGNNVRFHDYYSPGFGEDIEVIYDTTRVVTIPDEYKPFIIYPDDPICPPKPYDMTGGLVPPQLRRYIYLWDGKSFCQEEYYNEGGITDIPKNKRRFLYVTLEWTCPIPLFGIDGTSISPELDVFLRQYLYVWDKINWPPSKVDISLLNWNDVFKILDKLYYWDKKNIPVKVLYKNKLLDNLPKYIELNICYWDNTYIPYIPYIDYSGIEINYNGDVVIRPSDVHVKPYNYIIDGSDVIIVDPGGGSESGPVVPPSEDDGGTPTPIPFEPGRRKRYDVYVRRRIPTSRILPGVSKVPSFRRECISELEAEVEIVDKIIEERKFVLPSKPLSETSVIVYLGQQEILLKYGYDYVVYRQYNYTTRKYGDYFVSWEPQFVSSNSVIWELIYYNIEFYGAIDKEFLRDIMERLPYEIFYVKYLFDACDEENMNAVSIAPQYGKLIYSPTKYSRDYGSVSFDDPSVRRLLVPNVVGFHLDQAKSSLSQAGFTSVKVVPTCSTNKFKNYVVRQEPKEYTEVGKGSMVVLYVSNGEICY